MPQRGGGAGSAGLGQTRKDFSLVATLSTARGGRLEGMTDDGELRERSETGVAVEASDGVASTSRERDVSPCFRMRQRPAVV